MSNSSDFTSSDLTLIIPNPARVKKFLDANAVVSKTPILAGRVKIPCIPDQPKQEQPTTFTDKAIDPDTWNRLSAEAREQLLSLGYFPKA